MRVLVACEFTGVVRDALTARGHYAMSCDLTPSETVGNHHIGNVLDIMGDGWDLMIAFPPCTYLCASGLHWNTRQPERHQKTKAALKFVSQLMDCSIPLIALENPIGCIGKRIRPADQIIQPYEFGEDASKKTCLWLKGLPPLVGTKFVAPRWICCGHVLPDGVGKYGCPGCNGDSTARPRWGNQGNGGQSNLSSSRAKDRSRTFKGIAEAMADQWV